MVHGRPVFQGGEGNRKPTPKKKLSKELSKTLSERRRRSLSMYKNFAQSDQMKDMLDEAINDSMLKDGKF